MVFLQQLNQLDPAQKKAAFAGMFVLFLFIIFLVLTLFNQSPPAPQPKPTPTPPQITMGPSPTAGPSPTPSPTPVLSAKNKIAFIRDGNLWLISPDGTYKQQLTQIISSNGAPFDLPHPVTSFSWSPNDSTIALISNNNLWTINIDERKRRKLTSLDSSEKLFQNPQWAPNGKKIAVEYRVTRNEVINGRKQKITEQSIQIFDREGSLLHHVNISTYFPENTNTKKHLQFLDWYPNNNNLLIYQFGDPSHRGVWSISLDKEDKNKIFDVYHPSNKNEVLVDADLSNDAEQITYSDENKVWLLETATKNKSIIAQPSGNITTYFYPSFSPDREKIVMETSVKGTTQLYLAYYYPNHTRFDFFWTGLYGAVKNTSWSPSSLSLAFNTSTSEKSEETSLWVMDVGSHAQIQITTDALLPKWSSLTN